MMDPILEQRQLIIDSLVMSDSIKLEKNGVKGVDRLSKNFLSCPDHTLL